MASKNVFCSCALALLRENHPVHPTGESAPTRNPQSASKSKITCIILNYELGTMDNILQQSLGAGVGVQGFFREFWGLTVLTSFL